LEPIGLKEKEFMAKTIERFVKRLITVEYWLVVPLFLWMLALMFIQVIYRYVLEIPLPWCEELCRFLFIISSFLGGAVATAERSHIEINFVELFITTTTTAPAKRNKRGIFFNVFRDIVVIAVSLLVVIESWKYVIDAIHFNQVSVAMEMPMWIVSGLMLLGIVLVAVHSVLNIALNVNGLGPTGYEFGEEKTV
jgi:TRAP-type transport system small permease protein